MASLGEKLVLRRSSGFKGAGLPSWQVHPEPELLELPNIPIIGQVSIVRQGPDRIAEWETAKYGGVLTVFPRFRDNHEISPMEYDLPKLFGIPDGFRVFSAWSREGREDERHTLAPTNCDIVKSVKRDESPGIECHFGYGITELSGRDEVELNNIYVSCFDMRRDPKDYDSSVLYLSSPEGMCYRRSVTQADGFAGYNWIEIRCDPAGKLTGYKTDTNERGKGVVDLTSDELGRFFGGRDIAEVDPLAVFRHAYGRAASGELFMDADGDLRANFEAQVARYMERAGKG